MSRPKAMRLSQCTTNRGAPHRSGRNLCFMTSWRWTMRDCGNT
nr:MAG TPA: hypothetical protein [Caudoviricetes sp.]